MSYAFVLGAGSSQAVSSHLPLTGVADFVTGWTQDLGLSAFLASAAHADAPACVTWGKDQHAAVIAFDVRDDEVLLHVGPIGNVHLLGRQRDSPGDLIPELPAVAAMSKPGRRLRV